MPVKSQQTRSPDQPSFETAIERLEQIVGQMENDKLPLEDLLVRYEEGIKLVRICSDKLDAAEKKIEMITRDATGKSHLADFDASEKTAAKPGGDAALF